MASLSMAFDILARDKGASQTLDKVGNSADRTGGKLAGLGSKAKVALAGAGVAIVGFAKSSVDAFVEAEASQSQLTAAFAKFPALAGGNIGALRDLNSELATKTKFDDDATASGQAALAQFGLTADQIAKLTPLVQDYAATTGKDLPAAFQDAGKAMLGQGRAFKSIGLNLKDTGSAAGNFEQLMGGLSQQVGGFAEKEGKTAAGQAAILTNQFGELQETVGSKLVPVLLKLANFLTTSVLPAVQKIGAWLSEHKPILIAFAAVVGTGLVVAFTAWATSAAAAAAATIAATAPVIAIGAAIAALVAGVVYAYQNWDAFRSAVDAVAAFITGTLWPALQSLASFFTDTLAPAIAGVFDWVRDHWQLLLGILTGPIGAAVLIIQSHWDTIMGGVTAVKDWISGTFDSIVTFVTGLPGRIKDAASGMWDGIKDAFRSAINWVIDALNKVKIGSVTIGGFDIPGPGPNIPSFTTPEIDPFPDVKRLHTGDIFRTPRPGGEGLALLKDREGVFTPGQMQALGRGKFDAVGEDQLLELRTNNGLLEEQNGILRSMASGSIAQSRAAAAVMR